MSAISQRADALQSAAAQTRWMQTHFIPDSPPSSRPRRLPLKAQPQTALPPRCLEAERLCALGQHALLDHELLAFALGGGLPNPKKLAQSAHLLDQLGGVAGLVRHLDSLSWDDDAAAEGLITAARHRQLAASLALFRRGISGPRPGVEIDKPSDLAPWIRSQLGSLCHEVFGAAFINNRGRLIKIEVLFVGGINQTSVYPREIARRALILNATRLVLFHNHPSGTPEPSMADLRLTRQLFGMLQGLEVSIWDHLLLAGEQVLSIGNGSA